MTYPDNIPTFRMSPQQFASTSSIDINKVRPQFHLNNEQFEPRSSMDSSYSFKRPRISDNNHSNALMGPPPRMNHPPPDIRTDNMFFKTRICFSFCVGNCRNGESCRYAHGVEEIRQPPPNWQEIVHDQKIIQKRKPCKYVYYEQCPYGDNCTFLHKEPAKFGDDSWRTRRESSSISIGTIGNNLKGDKTVTKPPRDICWKTKLCLRWKHTGRCPYGDDCPHGDAEIQVFGGGVEAEAAVAITNSPKAVIPTLPTMDSFVNDAPTILPTMDSFANDAPTILPTSVPAAMEEEKRIKKELLWKKLNKINRIYGDWIDY